MPENPQRTINNNNKTNTNASHEDKITNDVSEQTNPTPTISSSPPPATAAESTPNNDEFSKEQPDPDNIKMFVGQIPKTLDEIQLKKMFEQFGRVHTINVLRDKVTGVSKGKNKKDDF